MANEIDLIFNFLNLAEKEIERRFTKDATVKNVLYHFVERGIIEPKRLRNYVIISDFDKILKENNGHCTHTFMDLSIKYNLSERQIQSIVYKQRYKNKKISNIK
tara:strand:- start:1051 stop:1362 length:312 start_codon:yes stop_codon:yes gene_type:complete